MSESKTSEEYFADFDSDPVQGRLRELLDELRTHETDTGLKLTPEEVGKILRRAYIGGALDAMIGRNVFVKPVELSSSQQPDQNGNSSSLEPFNRDGNSD